MSASKKKQSDTTHFGYREVPVAEKQKLVGQVFTSVADRYDLMNDLMSAGVHRIWKRLFVGALPLRPGHRVLDLAGGTGDIASLMAPRLDRGTVVLADINGAMLSNGRDRLIDEGLAERAAFAQVNAESLPFANDSFDGLTMAFGLRNVTDKEAALAEMARVLKPGGFAAILEFSDFKPSLLRPVYDWYSFNVLPKIGAAVANDEESYRYLAESIRRHPDQETLRQMMLDAGFDLVDYRNMSGGLVAVHTGYTT